MGDFRTTPRVQLPKATRLSFGRSEAGRQQRQISRTGDGRRVPLLLSAGALAAMLIAAGAAPALASVPEDDVNGYGQPVIAESVTPAQYQARRGPVEDTYLAGWSAAPEQGTSSAAGEDASPNWQNGPRALPDGADGEATGNAVVAYQAKPGESLEAIAQRFRVDSARLAAQNGVDSQSKLEAGQVLQVDLGVSLLRYIVKAGDTLSLIARQHGVDWPYLAAINNMLNPNLIHPGQVVLVPPGNPPVADRPMADAQAAPAATATAPQPAESASPAPEATQPQPQPEQQAVQAAVTGKREQPAPSTRGGRTTITQQEQFLSAAVDAAVAAQQATGVPASVTIAQAILESDWGRATIGANNYFGIKAETKPGPAGVVWAPTKEYTSNGWATVLAPFRAYENMAQSFIDHGKFFLENPRYAEALRQATDPKLFAQLIQKAGYATDPVYAQSLIRLMDQFDLYRYDQQPTANADGGQGQAAGQPGEAQPQPAQPQQGDGASAGAPSDPSKGAPAQATPVEDGPTAAPTPEPTPVAPTATPVAVSPTPVASPTPEVGNGVKDRVDPSLLKPGLDRPEPDQKMPAQIQPDQGQSDEEQPASNAHSILGKTLDLLRKLRP